MVNGEKKEKEIKQIQLQGLPEAKPFFSDGIAVSSIFQEYGKNKERDSTINMTFLNQNIVVSNIRITIEHAKAFVEVLKEKIEVCETFKKTGKKPKKPIIDRTIEGLTYIG